MIHPLYDALPCAVSVGNKSYPIITDYRDWVAFFDMLQDDAYTNIDKIKCAMQWYDGDVPPNTVDAYNALIQFASLDCMPKVGILQKNKSDKQLISYLYDSPCIYGDFLRYYRIDLLDDSLHWYKFRMLLDALPDDSATKQRASYRAINIASIKDKDRRKQIRKIQDSIWIPQKEMDAGDIGNAFG